MTALRKTSAILSFVFALSLGACAKKSSEPAKQYPLHGVVTNVDAQGHVATIKHDAIPNFMGAMTMGYQVKDDAELAKLKSGEEINATVFVKDDDMWVANIKPAGQK